MFKLNLKFLGLATLTACGSLLPALSEEQVTKITQQLEAVRNLAILIPEKTQELDTVDKANHETLKTIEFLTTEKNTLNEPLQTKQDALAEIQTKYQAEQTELTTTISEKGVQNSQLEQAVQALQADNQAWETELKMNEATSRETEIRLQQTTAQNEKQKTDLLAELEQIKQTNTRIMDLVTK